MDPGGSPQTRVADLTKDPHDHRVVLINCAKMHSWIWVPSHQLIMRAHLQHQPRLVERNPRMESGRPASRVHVPQADGMMSAIGVRMGGVRFSIVDFRIPAD